MLLNSWSDSRLLTQLAVSKKYASILKTLCHEKGSPVAIQVGQYRLDARQLSFGLKLSHSQDFIPIHATVYAVKPLKRCLRITRFGAAGYIRQVSAKMALSQAIAYDKTLIHEKTKVIRL